MNEMKSPKMNNSFLKINGGKVVKLLLVSLFLCGMGLTVMADNLSVSNLNQVGRITGIVTDDSGLPLIGVAVSVKGTNQGVVTDIDGNFTLEVSGNAVLVFSYIGMETVEFTLSGQRRIEIVLKEDSQFLDEVVVIGYGTVKKSNLSGAVSTVSSKDLKKLPASNLSQALQGSAPGLHASQNNRAPGEELAMTIRGNNSFSGGSPLYIVDGFPVVTGGGMSAINPNDIESISVLKDASSTAIYGARAANGVILITTKSGKVGKVSVDVDVFTGIKYFNNPVKLMNAEQFAQLRRESYEMDGISTPSNAFLDTELAMLDAGRSTDWWDEVTNQGSLTQSYQASFTSGNEISKIYVGAGFLDEQGIVNNSRFTRGSLRFNASQKIGKRVTLSSFNSVSLISKRGSDAESVLFPSVVGNPMSPVVDPNGEYYAMIQNALGTPRLNPVAFTELPVNKVMEPILNLSLALDINLMDGLNLRTQLSGEIDNKRENFYNPRAISGNAQGDTQGADGFARIRSGVNYNWISETFLSYNKLINKNHHIEAMAGFSIQENIWETVEASATGFASDIYEYNNLGAGSGQARKPSSDMIDWRMISYVGRAIYTLNDKYIFTANMRADGSSRFAKNKKYGYFPSGAVAWKLGDEEFMRNLDWLSDLKVRASYGISGNANAIGVYQTLSKLYYTNYNFDGKEAPAYYSHNMPSPDIKWESTYQLNLGLDASILDRRLNFTLDYYSKKTKDLIRQISIPSVAGFPNTYANMGDMKNTGVELAINSVNIDKELVWETTFTFAANKNKLISLGDGSKQIGVDHWVGKPLDIGKRYMIRADGIWQLDQEDEAKKYGAVPGDVRYVDENKDGQINDDDRVFIGSLYPKFYGSMVNDLRYKNFDLNIFMTFEQGRDIYNGNNYILLSGSGVDNNRIEMLDRWTPNNQSDKYPRASATASNRLSVKTSEFLEDGSFIKVKNITLGYTLPSAALKKIGINNLRVYGSIVNPLTFTKFTGMDPEDSDIGNTDRSSSYPVTRNYVFGIQAKF